MLRRLTLIIYGILFALLAGIVLAVQIGAFAAMYQPPLIGLLTVSTCAFVGWGYWRFGTDWVASIQPDTSWSRPLRVSLLLSAVMLIGVVVVARMILWPQSALGALVPSDFQAYHGVKMLDLLRNGTVWNLALPYGQYPYGYEGLLAFFVWLTGSLSAIGSAHALIAILLWLTLALLLVRWTQMPISAALLIAALLHFLPLVYSHVLVVGKNDLLLSLTILMAILHAPVGDTRWHPFGLALATMLSLATKATGLYVLFYLWLLVLWGWWRAYRVGKAQAFLRIPVFALLIAVMFPGGLWVIRNLIMLGELYTSEVASFFQTSIAANLFDPLLWTAGSESLSLVISGLSVLILMFVAWRHPRLGWPIAGMLLVVAVTFAVTPLSAFLTVQTDFLRVQWRFVTHGLLLAALIGIVLVWPLALHVHRRVMQSRIGHGALIVAPLIGAGLLLALLARGGSFALDSSRSVWLTDPLGDQASIYDAVAELPQGVLYLGPDVSWFHVMTANPKLTVTQGLRYPLGRPDVITVPSPDYAVAGVGFAPPFPDLDTPYPWQLIHEDATGTLYQRVP